MTDPIIGREDELDSVRVFFSSARGGPAALLLEGDAGIGKTTLWAAGMAAAGAEPNRRILRARPAEAETAMSFAGLADLLVDVLDAALAELPAPQRHALEVALLLEPGGPRAPDHRAVGAGFLGAVRALACDGPLLVAIDDVQWLDPPSAAAVAFALRRLTDERVDFLLAQRLAPEAPLALGLDRPPAELELLRVRVEALSFAALQRLLRSRLGASFPRPALRRIHETSGGNPFFALELGRALGQAEGLEPGEPLPVPDELRLLVRRRLAGLPAATADALLAAALMVQPTLARLEAALGAQPGSALEPAVDAHVVRLDGERLRFTHPLLASGLVEGVDLQTRRALHRRLAEIAADPEERARHLALGAEGPDESIAATLADTAVLAAARGAPQAAADLAERAARLTPPGLEEERAGRMADAGWHTWQAGDAPRARALLEEALAECPSGAVRARALDKLVRLEVQTGDRRAVPALYRAALAEAGQDLQLRADLEEILGWGLLLLREDLPAAARHGRSAVALAERIEDPALLSEALSVQAQSEFLLGGGLPSAPMERALALQWSDPAERAMRHPKIHSALLLQCADRFDEARELLEEMRRRALVRGDESALPWISMRLSNVELFAGSWERSLEHAEVGHDHGGQESLLLCTLAVVAAHLGREAEARAALEQALPRCEALGDGVGSRQGRWALGHLALSLGDAEHAERVLGELWRDSLTAGIVEPGENRYLLDLAEALVALGRLDEADEIAAELERRGSELARPAVLAVAAHCRGVVACARDELDRGLRELEHALVFHDRVTLPFHRARTLLALGAAQRRSRRRRDARATLEHARAALEELGASLWVPRAADELARIGGRAPSDGQLTPSEQRVADLVAEGRTNREVAAALVVTERTVETHLSHIYRKLGVRSRTELSRRGTS